MWKKFFHKISIAERVFPCYWGSTLNDAITVDRQLLKRSLGTIVMSAESRWGPIQNCWEGTPEEVKINSKT